MHFIMDIPGLEELHITKSETNGNTCYLHVEKERCAHRCPACDAITSRVHDYRMQKIQHLKWFERTTYLFYRRRRYRCACGKRFSESTRVVERYQRHSVEWNQALGLRVIQGKHFKDTAGVFRTSSSTVMRRFDQIAVSLLQEVETLPPVLAIDEYKGDTNAGTYQVILADGETGLPLDILPDRSVDTVKRYLQAKGEHVSIVVMDMSYAFKSAVRQALGDPIIVADRFHFCRYIYWALDRIRRRVQHDFHPYDRKKCKRMKHVFYKPSEQLTEKQRWYLERYLALSSELTTAYTLKESYRHWFERAKTIGRHQGAVVKEELYALYDQVQQAGLPEFVRAIETFQRWQPEILNSFLFGYTNGPIEGLNNQTKVIKRNAFGFRRYDRLRHRILLHHFMKHQSSWVG